MSSETFFADTNGTRLDLPDAVTAIAWADRQTLLAASADGQVSAFGLEGQAGTARLLWRARGHKGAALGLVAAGANIFSCGEDGALVRYQRADGIPSTVWERPRAWLEQIALHADKGLIALGVARQALVLDLAGQVLATHQHEGTVEGLAFHPKGFKLALAGKDGVAVVLARAGDAKPVRYDWKGTHQRVLWSPDGEWLVTAMFENALHGWRMKDGVDFRMGGYPARIASLSWMAGGQFLATSGAPDVIVWPFTGKNGPMGAQAQAMGLGDDVLCTACSGHPGLDLVAAGYQDGGVLVFRASSDKPALIDGPADGPVDAIAFSPDGRALAYARQDGTGAIVCFPVAG